MTGWCWICVRSIRAMTISSPIGSDGRSPPRSGGSEGRPFGEMHQKSDPGEGAPWVTENLRTRHHHAATTRAKDGGVAVASTAWGLRLKGDKLFLSARSIPVDLFLDGLKRFVFVEDRQDLERVSAGDLVVAFGGTAGRSFTAVTRLAKKLETLGAAGVLLHERTLKDPPDKLPEGEGPFPVLIVPGDLEWPDILRPLLRVDPRLRGRSGDPERRRRRLMRAILDRGGRTEIDTNETTDTGLDLSGSFRVLVVGPLAPPSREIARKLEELVAADLMSHDPLGTVVSFDDVVVAIESIASIDLDKDRLASSLLLRARSLLSLGDVMVGAGRILTGTDGIFRSYREARWAALVGYGQHGPNRVIDFSDLGVYAWLEPIDFDQRGQAVTEIQRIIEHDVQHGTRLLETLQTYLDARRFNEAADRLYVHRNTLRYRLDSIRKLTGLDVQDAESRLVLEIQLRLARVRGLVPSDVKAEL
ncbi:MAG: hypothetical protein GEU78_05300 [Actinobacteria bacterium]|nr:hypothetical protein [Actinomycetota bacterium]